MTKAAPAIPKWILVGPKFDLRTPSAKLYTEYFITIHNSLNNSRLTFEHPLMEKKLKEFIAQKAMYRPEWFEQAFGYALAKGKEKDRDVAHIDCILFKEFCRKLIWEACVTNGYLEVAQSESEFKKYSGL